MSSGSEADEWEEYASSKEPECNPLIETVICVPLVAKWAISLYQLPRPLQQLVSSRFNQPFSDKDGQSCTGLLPTSTSQSAEQYSLPR